MLFFLTAGLCLTHRRQGTPGCRRDTIGSWSLLPEKRGQGCAPRGWRGPGGW